MVASFEPTWKSLREHEVPAWFHDAKFGIFIHWGLYSVPAYAPTGMGDINEIILADGWEALYKNQPYAEWYLNSLRIEGSPVQKYHRKHYEGRDYDDFVSDFNEAIQDWDPVAWANLFKQAGAQYVVLVTKHHDGFLLWPSTHPNPRNPEYHASRDIVGELSREVKARGMRMGTYYSSLLDWSFSETPVTDIASMVSSAPRDPEYAVMVQDHWQELIDRYGPTILWSDIGYPPKAGLKELLAYFYNSTPEGLINDRWFVTPKSVQKVLKTKLMRKVVGWAAKRAFTKGATTVKPRHSDFTTPEYTSFGEIRHDKWECCRGIGKSFAYNQVEKLEDYLTVADLVRSFVDIVSKNGNLLLNVGPMADGTIPEVQVNVLKGFGGWLTTYGDGIYGTRPYTVAEGASAEGTELRFTQKENTLYCFFLALPSSQEVTIRGLQLQETKTRKVKIRILSTNENVAWKQLPIGLSLNLPAIPREENVICVSITPKPTYE